MEQIMFDSEGRAMNKEQAEKTLKTNEVIEQLNEMFPYMIMSGVSDSQDDGVLVIRYPKSSDEQTEEESRDTMCVQLVNMSHIVYALMKQSGMSKEDLLEALGEVIDKIEEHR